MQDLHLRKEEATYVRQPDRLRIYITNKDLREGEPGKTQKCAIARAVRRAIARKYAHVEDVFVSVNVATQGRDTLGRLINHAWKMSPELEMTRDDFDMFGPATQPTRWLKPGSYILREML